MPIARIASISTCLTIGATDLTSRACAVSGCHGPPSRGLAPSRVAPFGLEQPVGGIAIGDEHVDPAARQRSANGGRLALASGDADDASTC